MSAFLEVSEITMRFKGLTAVDRFSAELECGRIYGLIGTNGAGKTTLINILSGQQKPTSGAARLEGRALTGVRPDLVARMGVGRTYQNLRLFGRMTCLENVMIGAQLNKGYNLTEALLSLPVYWKREKALRETAAEMLGLVGIADKADLAADSLPYGDQRLLEIARTLAMKPKLLLLDEPAAMNALTQKARSLCLASPTPSDSAAVAGGLWAHLVKVISPSFFYYDQTFTIVETSIIGGMYSLSGAVVGALIMTFVPEYLAGLETGITVLGIQLPQIYGAAQLILSALLIVIIIYRRKGIMGYSDVIVDSWFDGKVYRAAFDPKEYRALGRAVAGRFRKKA